MNILVVGLGSMGRRRIRLIKQGIQDAVVYGVDSNCDRIDQAKKELGIEAFSSIKEAIETVNFECGFVCTAPLTHSNIIKELLQNNLHVFTELNLIMDGYEELIHRENKNLILFMSSTLLYRKDIEYIKNKVAREVVNYNYHTGQYLPDWHPWENYNNFFVGDRRTNGCREIFAIDLPWIIKTFGPIKDIVVKKSKLSTLNIDYDDNYLLILEHENGSKGTVCVDVVSRKAMRRLEIFSENLHIFWNGTPDSLEEYNFDTKLLKNIPVYDKVEKNSNYCDNIIENAYMEEIETFIHAVKTNNVEAVKYTIEDDLITLQYIDKIEGINQ